MGFVISMKFFSKFRMLAMLVAALMAIGTRAEAQGFGYSLSWSGSPNPAEVNSNLTYDIYLTNTAGVLPFVYVTNTLDVHSTFVSATNTYTSSSTATNGNVVVFNLVPFGLNGVAHMTVIVRPTALGLITNTLALNFYNLTNFSTNIINQVTNLTPLADLAVGMTGPSSQVFSNDWMTYGVSITNLGPASASNVMLTNTLPTNVLYKSVSPASLVPSIQGSNVIFNLGQLASGAFANLHLTVQPTNAGTKTFVSVVNSTSVTDTNLANNSASINVVVSNFLSNPGQLTAIIVSTQKFNPQNSLMEQLIVVSNAGPSVPAARVIVSGLTNSLYNAVGTNNGSPFVVYDASLDSIQSAYLLLQYFVPSHRTSPDPQLTAVGVTLPDLSPPANLSTNMPLLGIARLSSGYMLIAFPSVSNRTYTVEYTSNLISTFYITNYVTSTNNPGVTNIVVQANSVFSTNWLATQPAVTATANFTQWIDYGPPGTVGHPTNTPVRFYRVFLNP